MRIGLVGFIASICTLSCALSAVGNTVAYWRLEGTPGTSPSGSGSVHDDSVNGHDGTPFNGPTYSASVPVNPLPGSGMPDTSSMSFDGVSQGVFVPDATAFKLTHSLTLEAFIDAQSIVAGNQAANIIFRGDDLFSRDPYRLTVGYQGGPSNVVSFAIFDSNLNNPHVDATFPLNQWVDVAGTLDDATGLMSLYINGALAASMTTASRPYADLDSGQNPGLAIGSLQSGNTVAHENFHGLIDEVRISDVALPPSGFVNAPEPGAFALLLAALGLVSCRRRRSAWRAL